MLLSLTCQRLQSTDHPFYTRCVERSTEEFKRKRSSDAKDQLVFAILLVGQKFKCKCVV